MPNTPPPDSSRPPLRPRWDRIIALALVAALSLAGLIWLLRPSGGSSDAGATSVSPGTMPADASGQDTPAGASPGADVADTDPGRAPGTEASGDGARQDPGVIGGGAAQTARTPARACAEALAQEGSVLVVGDSLTVGAAATLSAEAAAAGIPLCLDAQRGRNSQEGNTVLRRMLDDGTVGPRTTVVMAFGANDVAGGPAWGACQSSRALAAVGADRALLWVNGYNAVNPEYSAGQQTFNSQVAETDEKAGSMAVLDWHGAASAHSEYISRDRVHPTDAGQRAWLDLVLGGVREERQKLTFGGQVPAPSC